MTVTFDDRDFFRSLDEALGRVARGAEIGLEDLGEQIAEGTRARLLLVDPDAADTVSVNVKRAGDREEVEVLVGAWDVPLIEFGTVNNAPRPAMRPAIEEAHGRAAETFKRAAPKR